jgi:hypothetical protein
MKPCPARSLRARVITGEGIMKNVLAVAAAVVLLLASAGCGGGDSPGAATPVSSRALISVSQTDVGLVGLSSSPAHLLRLELPVRINNNSDVPCQLNYLRLQLYLDDVEIERAEVTADDIAALAGTNRVARTAPLTLTLVFNFNSQDFTLADLTLSGRDDNGHDIEQSLQNLQVELAPELLAAHEPSR